MPVTARAHDDRMATVSNVEPNRAPSPPPRGCPGTHLALFLAQKVVGFVVAGMEAERADGARAEL